MRIRTRRAISKETRKPQPVRQNWFDGKSIILLRADGDRNYYGVRDDKGDVVSRVELRSSTTTNREAARRQESVNVLLAAIDAKETSNGTTE